MLITAGWVMLFSQPPNAVQRHISTWSQDIGIRDVVQNLREYVGILAFGLGLVFGYTFDTTGPRRTTAVVDRDREVVREPDGRAEDEPTLRDRETTGTPSVAGRGFLGRRRNADPAPGGPDGTAADGTPVDADHRRPDDPPLVENARTAPGQAGGRSSLRPRDEARVERRPIQGSRWTPPPI